MDKFLASIQPTYSIKLFLKEILHSLYIMVGHILNLLDTNSISLREITVYVTQRFEK